MAAASRWSASWILASVLASVLATVLPAHEALSASANVSPASGAGGKQVTLSSSGFDLDGVGYNTGFYAVIGNGLIGACPLSNPANCAIQVNLPAYFPGAFEIEARNSAGETGTATYTVAVPQFSISPACGAAGTTVTAEGKFFAVNADAGLKFDGSYVATNNYPDASGNFSRSFVVPAAAEGSHPVLVQNSAGNSDFQDFKIPCAAIGEVEDLTGPVFRCVANCDAPNPADHTLVPVGPGDPVRQDDRFETGANGRVNFGFQDGTEITLSQKSKFNVNDYTYDGQSNTGTERYSVLGGAFQYVSGLVNKHDDSKHAVVTAYGAIGIRGTWFVTRVDELAGHQEVYLSTGQVTVTPDGTGVTSVFDGPVTIVFDANGVSSSGFVDTDADGIAGAVDNCPTTANADQADTDGDTVGNVCDNCSLVTDTTQLDADQDGYGNVCDADLNNTGLVTAQDNTILRNVLNQPASASPTAAAADLNGSGLVTAQDSTLLRNRLNTAPGPSGFGCAGTVPCP